ncbi:MAG TPA: hypothetical protein PLH09_02845, partial [Lentimicrobium sp.]|nr:hypothetical protein [Lentimicrobium sp.]
MKQILISFFRQMLFWLLFFAFARTVFMLYNFQLLRIEGVSFGEAMAAYRHGFQLDFATTSYFMLFPAVLLLIQSLWSRSW